MSRTHTYPNSHIPTGRDLQIKGKAKLTDEHKDLMMGVAQQHRYRNRLKIRTRKDEIVIHTIN